MSTYREIIGKKIKKVSSDPSSGIDGEMWYNSTTGTLRGPAILSAWTSCGPLISVQGDMANVGIQTASLCAGGSNNPGSENVNITQEGNGTGFSQGGNLNTERRGCAGFGVQTSAVCFGGYTTTYDNNTEEYNGTAWTNGNDTPLSPGTASWNSGGTLTAGLGYGGSDLGPGATPPANRGKQTIEYDGTNWADGNQMTRSSGDGMTGFGIQTAALAAGQSTPPGSPSATTVVENYDGTNWTSGTVTPTGVAYCGSGGTQTAGLIFGGVTDGSPGYPTKVTTTLSWNGTSWSSEPALATARMGTWGGPVGSSTSSQLMGGNNGSSNVTNVENFDASTNVITAGAWASGTGYPTNLMYAGSAGNKTAAVVFGGSTAPPSGPNRTAATNEYDGTSWTGGGAMPAVTMQMANLGTQTAAGSFGGVQPPGNIDTGYEYDGSSWSSGGSIGSAGYNAAGFGTQTAGVIAGGSGDTDYSATYNGTAWTAKNNMSTGRYYSAGTGTTTAGIVMGGVSPPGAVTANTETFDGTSWTEVGNLVTAKRSQSGGGDSATDALLWAGYVAADSNTMEGYDGTSWSTRPSLAVSKRNRAGSGGSTNGIATGGINPVVSSVEQFTGATTSANIENFTTS